MIDKYIQRAIAIHGDTYDYSEATVSKGKITYRCASHGVITQDVNKHTVRGSGCRRCYLESMKGRVLEKNKDAIKVLAAERGSRYDYSLSVYRSAKSPIDIKCGIHGVFSQRYDHHRGGANCPSCANLVRSESLLMNKDEFVSRSIAIHGSNYSYDDVLSVKRRGKVSITCNGCKSTFKQRVDLHLNGHGCPTCNTGEVIGFKKSEFIGLANLKNNGDAIFYILKCRKDAEVFYKVGITTNSINVRYNSSKMPYDYDVIMEVKTAAKDAWEMEKEYIRKNSDTHYTPLIPFSGCAKECFSELVGIT